MAVFNHDEDEVAELLAEPDAVGLSDAGAREPALRVSRRTC
jgi:N-acyl-D-aspartate/D-glutamate deacylase